MLQYLLHDWLRDVEDPLAVQSEAIVAVIALNEALHVVPNILGKFLEKHLRFFFCQRSHFISYDRSEYFL